MMKIPGNSRPNPLADRLKLSWHKGVVSLFLVQLPSGYPAQWLFLHRDPLADGCPYEATPDVELDDDSPSLDDFMMGDSRVELVLGRSLDRPNFFKRFS